MRDAMELAERVGFEPTNTLRCYLTSNQAPSTARPSLRPGGMIPRPRADGVLQA
ncbi:MAG: hypothetical protein RLZ79_1498 [Pseudomonadota bacterium]|jgi:hypothetical protein